MCPLVQHAHLQLEWNGHQLILLSLLFHWPAINGIVQAARWGQSQAAEHLDGG